MLKLAIEAPDQLQQVSLVYYAIRASKRHAVVLCFNQQNAQQANTCSNTW